mgnify:CR=1 FL=1
MKSTNKFSPVKLRQVFETIEMIAVLNNPEEDNQALSDIYCIAHAYAGRCPHPEWRELEQEITAKLKCKK